MCCHVSRSCPGVYMTCGAALVCNTAWYSGAQRVYWACSTRPACNFICWPPERVEHPQVTMEITSAHEFAVSLTQDSSQSETGCRWHTLTLTQGCCQPDVANFLLRCPLPSVMHVSVVFCMSVS